jgi:hypothetical protein
LSGVVGLPEEEEEELQENELTFFFRKERKDTLNTAFHTFCELIYSIFTPFFI